MNKELQQRDKKYKKITKRSQRAEEYDNWKNTLGGLNRGFDEGEEKISQFENKATELTQLEQ